MLDKNFNIGENEKTFEKYSEIRATYIFYSD